MDNYSVISIDEVNNMYDEVTELLDTLGDSRHIETTFRILKSVRDQLQGLGIDQDDAGESC